MAGLFRHKLGTMGMSNWVDGGTSCALPVTPMMRVSHTVSEMRERGEEGTQRREKTEEEEEEVCANPASGHGSSADPYPQPLTLAGEREKQGRERKQRTHHGPNPHRVRAQRTSTAAEPRTDHAVAQHKRVQMNGQPHLGKMRVIFIQNAGFVAAFSPFRRESVMLAAFRTTDKVTDLESASAASGQAIKE